MKENSNKTNLKRKVKGVEINVSQYARDNNISWATAKKKILGIERKKREFKGKYIIDDYIDIIKNKVENYDCSAVSIFNFIKEKGYEGSLSTITKIVASLKTFYKRKATIRIETTPGLQAQVDWKETMTLYSKSKEKFVINIFLYILSYSKYKYIELTIDRTQQTLFRCMINAFKYCGNKVPDEIWFDNMKTVVESHNIDTNEVKFNSTFYEFSKNCGFKAIACKPYRPCTKGIAENLAKLMERLRVYNEEFETYEELMFIIKKLNTDLNKEVSQATNKAPIDLFNNKEKEYLTTININQFNYSSRPIRKVSKESMINYNNCKYSVPIEYISLLVEIDIKDNELYIYYSGKEIACHQITNNKFNYTEEHLLEIIPCIFPNKNKNELEILANNRLKGFDCFDRKEKKKYE